MSKFTEQLRKIGIVNMYDFMTDGMVCVRYEKPVHGRRGMAVAHGWCVYRRGFKTDPDAIWFRHGNKYFVNYGSHDKEEKRLEAFKWAEEKYGITEWTKTPFGDYMDAEFVKSRIAELKAKIKESIA